MQESEGEDAAESRVTLAEDVGRGNLASRQSRVKLQEASRSSSIYCTTLVVCAFMCICRHVYVYVYVHVHVHLHLHLHVHVYAHVYMYMCTRIYIYVRVFF